MFVMLQAPPPPILTTRHMYTSLKLIVLSRLSFTSLIIVFRRVISVCSVSSTPSPDTHSKTHIPPWSWSYCQDLHPPPWSYPSDPYVSVLPLAPFPLLYSHQDTHTSLKLILLSRSSSTSLIIALRPICVCGASSFSIISFSSIRSMNPSLPTSYL